MFTIIHQFEVRVPDPFNSSAVTKVKVTTPEELAALHALVVREGRLECGDDGDAENGPRFWCGPHHLGRLSAFHKDPTVVMSPDSVYVSGRDLPRVLAESLGCF